MRSFAIATLISAVAANTYTAYSTKIESVISCAADVTDCPGSSTVYHATPTETSTTCTTTDEAHPTVPATWTHPAVTTSAPVYTTTSTADAHKPSTVDSTTCTEEETKTWETYTKPSKPTHYVTGAVAPHPSASASGPGKVSSASGYAKPTGTGAVYPTAPAYTPSAAKGDASAIRAAGALAGAGALLAFLL